MTTMTKSTSNSNLNVPVPESIPLRVLILRGPDPFVTEPFEAHCLEYDFVEAGPSAAKALRNWLNAFHGHIQSDVEEGREPLHNVPRLSRPQTPQTDPNYLDPPTDIELSYELATQVLGISAPPFHVQVRCTQTT